MTKLLLIGTAAILCAVGASAGPALSTEDPGTPGPGGWEINLGWAHERRPGERGDARPIVDVNYGLGDRLQLKYEIAWLSLRPNGGPAAAGTGLSIAGVKWRFWESEENGSAASVFPRIEFRSPGSKAAQRGLVPDENVLLLPGQWKQSLGGGFDLLLDVGVALPSKSDEAWFGGLALLRVFDHGIELAAEIVTEMDHRWHRASAGVNLSVMVPMREGVALLVSLGRELSNAGATRAHFIGYTGVQLTF